MLDVPQGYSLTRQDLNHVDGKLGSSWNEMAEARLFISGGTGFFGIWLIESLLWMRERRHANFSVTVLSRDPETFLAGRARHLRDRPGLTFLRGGIADFDQGGGPYTHIVHAASEGGADGDSHWAGRHLVAALDGTRRILDMAAAHQCDAVLLTSSGAAYIPMDPPAQPRCVEGPAGIVDYVGERAVYGQAKRIMEVLAAVGAQAHGYRALIARCFAFVGPYLPLDGNYAIGNFIGDALARRPIVVNGDGTPLRSYLYAADLVVWLLTILVKGRSGTPYNVGGETAYSIADVARAVARAAGRSEVLIRRPPVPGARPQFYLPDLGRARRDLGLTVDIDLGESVARTLAWHRCRQGQSRSPS